jgi:hypothetical protein
MPPSVHPLSTRNVLRDRAPELVERLAAIRGRVYDMLLDALAATHVEDPNFQAPPCLHPYQDIRATALILRVLTKELWTANDLKLFDACWREATLSDLFADAFETDRHRIQHAIAAGRQQLSAKGPASSRP